MRFITPQLAPLFTSSNYPRPRFTDPEYKFRVDYYEASHGGLQQD